MRIITDKLILTVITLANITLVLCGFVGMYVAMNVGQFIIGAFFVAAGIGSIIILIKLVK